MRTPIRSSCLTRSEIVCREWLAVKDLLSGSGGLGNAAARTCFGVGRRFKSNDANHDYDGNDNRNNAASAPFSIVRVIWVRDAAIVLLVRHGLIPFLDIPPLQKNGSSELYQAVKTTCWQFSTGITGQDLPPKQGRNT